MKEYIVYKREIIDSQCSVWVDDDEDPIEIAQDEGEWELHNTVDAQYSAQKVDGDNDE